MVETVWILYGKTESDDEIGPFVWLTKPSKEQVNNTLAANHPSEWELGSDYLHYRIWEVTPNDRPTPVTLWCEWDIGQEGLVFTSEEAAWDWAESVIDLHDWDTAFVKVADLLDDWEGQGLIGVKEVVVA